MEALTFFSAMNRGQFREEQGIEGSSYCIFFAPMEELVTQDRMTGREDRVVLELLYGDEMLPGALRVRQVGSNAVVEESTQGAFRAFLEEKPVKYIGQLLMYALQFKIQDLSLRIEGCTGEMKQLEDALDNCIDNSGTYRLLDFRRRYTECGNMVLAVKEILSRIDKGYYPMQMQNSYVLQGEVLLEFRFLEERYELIKSTVLKDFDTYTSIINNNINRNARLLSIISLVGWFSTSCSEVCWPPIHFWESSAACRLRACLWGHGGLPCQPPRQCAASLRARSDSGVSLPAEIPQEREAGAGSVGKMNMER